MKVGVRLTWDTEKCLLLVLSGLILEKIYELFIVSNKTVGYIYIYGCCTCTNLYFYWLR